MTGATVAAHATRGARIRAGHTALGIELGSTRIKACLIDEESHEVLATGEHEWQNELCDGLWTYDLENVWAGIADAYARLTVRVAETHGVALERVGSLGVSAMMHGYLAFDASDRLLVPFRTWRNTNTGPAAAELTARFGQNIPLRWSVAHLAQAMVDREPHTADVTFLTTLAGYVHWQLTGERVLGVGDAAGMFPIDSTTCDYDETRCTAFAQFASEQGYPVHAAIRDLLPRVLPAGAAAGTLTEAGARRLDPAGTLAAGAIAAPPEGDAGTGMVATNAVAPRTGNISVGTSVFAMVVLERGLTEIHPDVDLVTTPVGDAVAMVHCNNGASELAAWAGVFGEFAAAIGADPGRDRAFAALLAAAETAPADAGGVLAYNQLSGEPIAGLRDGAPLVTRAPGAEFNLATLMRAQVYGIFGTLSLGMRALEHERVVIDSFVGHGGVFRTAGVVQQMLADALDTPVTIAETAAEGGAWGMAVLAAYRTSSAGQTLAEYLEAQVFAGVAQTTLAPIASGVAGYRRYLDHYLAGLAAPRAAVAARELAATQSGALAAAPSITRKDLS
ncbi:xylulokinase [Leucobacter sp. HY1910]